MHAAQRDRLDPPARRRQQQLAEAQRAGRQALPARRASLLPAGLRAHHQAGDLDLDQAVRGSPGHGREQLPALLPELAVVPKPQRSTPSGSPRGVAASVRCSPSVLLLVWLRPMTSSPAHPGPRREVQVAAVLDAQHRRLAPDAPDAPLAVRGQNAFRRHRRPLRLLDQTVVPVDRRRVATRIPADRPPRILRQQRRAAHQPGRQPLVSQFRSSQLVRCPRRAVQPFTRP